jgi:hypothetical protein
MIAITDVVGSALNEWKQGYLHDECRQAVHRQLHKLTKTKGAFPNENSLLKLL